ncbi:Peptidase family S41 [Planctomycetes bacterium Pla163]|uniref:Peptidase family S41 n=1 Tax=Rohdeia mirabilis TaxID=2528008 RepID=A0A518CXN2_9BACT|nr:Peptidase family S41 [Planctomycetes bacterium Pla163]
MNARTRPAPFGLLLALLIGLFTTGAFAQNADRKGSPFEGIRWSDAAPQVLVRGAWYAPVSIHGVEVNEILEFCEARWPGKREKRFAEDLVEAMTLMGHTVPAAVDLVLTRVADGERIELQGVAVTLANRQALRSAGDPRAVRSAAPASLTRERALEDLAELARRLQDQFAYLELGDFDWKAELDRIGKELPRQVATGEFAGQLERFMAHFRDGHASVSSDRQEGPSTYPPFLLQEAAGGVVAFRPDRSSLLDDEHPYVVEIDGVGIEVWIDRASSSVASGSPQLVRSWSLRGLRNLELLRTPEDGAAAGTVRVKLAAQDGSTTVERVLAMVPRRPIFGSWPATETRILDGDVGYLRLAAMDDALVPHLREAMESFRRTKGLVVDVRGNGGGSRSLLIALAGYLVGPDEGPWVGNVAKYRLSSRFDAGHLEARYMYRAADERWTRAQRRAVDAVAKRFEPEWAPPGAFSEWHYLVLDRTGHEDEYFYRQPVVVLSDAGCFSATDIFLAALSGRPRVTLMGSASSGGSARSQSFSLTHSGIGVRCASMASFRPDGRLYDGRGVEVDIEVPIQPTDLVRAGTDTVLEAALARVLE